MKTETGLLNIRLAELLKFHLPKTISVTDTGKGIASEEQTKLFQRFWAPADSGRQYASTGLGLYLGRKIVESHGGVIRCESELGKGSKFSFSIGRQIPDPTSSNGGMP